VIPAIADFFLVVRKSAQHRRLFCRFPNGRRGTKRLCHGGCSSCRKRAKKDVLKRQSASHPLYTWTGVVRDSHGDPPSNSRRQHSNSWLGIHVSTLIRKHQDKSSLYGINTDRRGAPDASPALAGIGTLLTEYFETDRRDGLSIYCSMTLPTPTWLQTTKHAP
jgi:hypothetical protein